MRSDGRTPDAENRSFRGSARSTTRANALRVLHGFAAETTYRLQIVQETATARRRRPLRLAITADDGDERAKGSTAATTTLREMARQATAKARSDWYIYDLMISLIARRAGA